jgi:hypothetical protein
MLITAAVARQHIPSLSGTSEDATVIEPLIRRVGAILARRAGYPGAAPSMEARTYTLDLAALSGRELDLEVYPVCSVTSASVDAAGDFEGDEETVSVADIVLRGRGTARLVSTSTSAWLSAPGANRVTFVAGYGGTATVSGAHTSSATTITVASTASLYRDESGLLRVTVGSEIIHATGKTATTLTGCTRGAEGTTAASISDGATMTQTIPEGLQEVVIEAVRYLFDQRAIAGKSAVTQGGATTTFLDAKGERDHLPDSILAGFGAYMLPRAVV